MTSSPSDRLLSREGVATDEMELRFSWWSFFWASAILFSLTASPLWFISLVSSFPSARGLGEVALAALALGAMFRPGSVVLLGVLAAAQLVHTGVLLPEVPNHRLVIAFGNLALVVSILGTFATRGARPLSAARIGRAFFPTGRALLLVVYLFAFFAKLNRDFFDPAASCAVQFYSKIAYWLPFLPETDGARDAVIWSTIAVEAILPFLLLVPRFRRVGVMLGILFHVGLSFDLLQHLVNFSSTMLALLVLFLPGASFRAAGEVWRKMTGGKGSAPARAIACSAFLVLFAVAFRAVGDDRFAVPFYALQQATFVGYAAVLFLEAIASRRSEADGEWIPRAPLQVGVLCLAVLNGLSPYLGLKTRTSFHMYSNLRMEATDSNHFLVPRSLDLLGFLSDTVTVLRTNDPSLPAKLTWFEFTAHVNGVPGIDVWYERRGDIRHLDVAGGMTPPPPPPWLLRKLLHFQALGSAQAGECVW